MRKLPKVRVPEYKRKIAGRLRKVKGYSRARKRPSKRRYVERTPRYAIRDSHGFILGYTNKPGKRRLK